MPDRRFSLQTESDISPEELALRSLPGYPFGPNPNGSTLFHQGATLEAQDPQFYYFDDDRSACPPEGTEGICSFDRSCPYSLTPKALEGSPSFADYQWYLFALMVTYGALTAYWSQVFPGGNGK